MYRPPFSGQVTAPAEDTPQAAAPGDKRVPKPIMASPCCAEAKVGRTKNAKTVARKANFLKGNLLCLSLLAVRCDRQTIWMQAHERSSHHSFNRAGIQSDPLIAKKVERVIKAKPGRSK